MTSELRSRYTPVLLMEGHRLIKTRQFSGSRYLGDPINTIFTFNEKCVDELILMDITRSSSSSDVDVEFLRKCAQNATMPICYGGGINTIDVALQLVEAGIEKLSLNSVLYKSPEFINKLSACIGAQSVAVCLDVRKNEKGEYCVYSNRNTVNQGLLSAKLNSVSNLNFGELIIHNIDRDGTKLGLDKKLIDIIWSITDRPVTFIGGSFKKTELLDLGKLYKGIGLGAGSAFVFMGSNDAVLPNYFSTDQKRFLY